MRKTIAFVLLLFIAAASAGEAWRLVPIPKREHGYNNFESTSFLTQKEFSAFLDMVDVQNAWNGKAKFVDALRAAKIDFSKEALVLLRHTEGSGSVTVQLVKPELKGATLVCSIKRQAPQMGTADMAFYCFAVVVDRTRVKNVEYRSQGKKQTFKIVTPPGK